MLKSGWAVYPFPLREDFIASFSLPGDLTRNEWKRITAFLETLILDGWKSDVKEVEKS
jgi:hypothetical protein